MPMTPNSDKDGASLRHDDDRMELLQPELSGQKRKEPEKQQKRFKSVAQLVMAMRRFQASLNPTYSYGEHKRASSTGGSSVDRRATSDGGEAAVNSRPGTAGGNDGRRSSGHGAAKVFADHGHKADYLLRPLPELPGEKHAEVSKDD